MLIYDEKHKVNMSEFGIEIPVFDTRASKTFEKLKSHKILGKKIKSWHVKKSQDKLTKNDLLRVHSQTYIDKLFSDELENEIIKTFELIDDQGEYYRYNQQIATLPLARLFDRILERAAGTYQCCNVALEKGFCFYCGGGMHHAQKSFGNGFCIINDIVIVIRRLQAENRIKKAWVIDLDAHKGDGTAALTEKDESITTLSIHMAHGWPLDEKKYNSNGRLNPSFIPSNIDIPVARGEDHLYVAKLKDGLDKLERFPKPDIAIVVSGADPYEKDALPSASDLKLSLEQLKQRDLIVYNFLKKKDIPRAYLMAGGYGQSSWKVYAQFLVWALLDHLSS